MDPEALTILRLNISCIQQQQKPQTHESMENEGVCVYTNTHIHKASLQSG